MALMIGLGVAGLLLLVAAPFIARLIVGREGDPMGVTRMFQGIGVILLIAALVFRPHLDDTAAFPPPPDMVEGR